MTECSVWRVQSIKSARTARGLRKAKIFRGDHGTEDHDAGSPLEAMQLYVENLQQGNPEVELNFSIKATRLDHAELTGYPFYKEHSSRVLGMFTMARMAIHVDPTLQRVTENE